MIIGWGVWVYGKNRIRVNITDNGDIGREYERTYALAVYDYAAAFVYLLRYAQGKASELAVYLRGKELVVFAFKYDA